VKNANTVFYGVMALVALSACGRLVQGDTGDVPPSPSVASGANPAPVRYGYKVIREWPHDPAAFTQGLVFRNGGFLESTGLNGESTLRSVDLETGRVLKRVSLPREYFAEGLAFVGNRAYQLTWQNHKGFIYDVDTFRAEGEFTYEGEGWGLATDGRWLVLSDGTSRIRFFDPDGFRLVRSIDVAAAGRPVERLNELEWINGEIFANVWQTDEVVRIDPSSGVVRGIIDFSGLLPLNERTPDTDVLNGIAYDAAGGRLFVTGKRWPRIYEVRLVPAASD
jgi:glutamine cyclotransferase